MSRMSCWMLLGFGLASSATAQRPNAREFVTVSDAVVALTNVTVIDGTGAPPARNQTIVTQGGKIANVGPASSVSVPAGAKTIDLRGSTVIPGIVGMHDHLFYNAVGGRQTITSFSAPRLYLGAGVTTIRTAGTISPYNDIATKRAIEAGQEPGPRVYITAPYITGNGPNGTGVMDVVNTPEQAKHFVDYWASEGATWLKAYADIRREELKAAIDEAHKRGIKVTGHLCSVTFQEAVDLGIDNLEHGYPTATDFLPAKQPDVCPTNYLVNVSNAAPNEATAKAVYKKMIEHKVSLTSTLPVFDMFMANRPYDPRLLDLMSPDLRAVFLGFRALADSGPPRWPFKTDGIKNAEAFEKGFFDAGGFLVAGCDPTGVGTPPGLGDQREYELLIEAGLTPSQTVQVMTANGAKILGAYDNFGSIERGKSADLVVLDGDLASDPTVIHKVTTVFKEGVGYDSEKLINSVKGHLGVD
jgi:imidazolonepropionase-like amidohydrolase